jgi:ribosomal protein S2
LKVALFTIIHVEGVEPTNNAAKRAARLLSRYVSRTITKGPAKR